MIGGYVYGKLDAELDSRLRHRLGNTCARIDLGGRGYLFHDDPFDDAPTPATVSGELTVLTQDILATPGSDGEYREYDVRTELAQALRTDERAAFDAIASDYRMAVVRQAGDTTTLYLVSNRAGSGRIYYHRLEDGLLFSSDLRFLLQVVKGQVSDLGIYAILKYGAVPEPMTICSNISAVPPAHYLTHEVGTGVQRHLPYFKLRFDCERGDGRDRAEDQFLPPVKEALQRSSRFLREYRPAIMLSGGIDSSLYGCYLSEAGKEPLQGYYCAFGDDDPEIGFARQIAERTGSDLNVARMASSDALRVLGSVTRLTDHPFSDFSSLPITFLLQFASERSGKPAMVIEGNGGDDCFGFPDLGNEGKYSLKHRVPRVLKRVVAASLGRSGYWRWETHQGALARLCAVADVHEPTPLNYFFVLTPVGYLELNRSPGWDDALWALLEHGFAGVGEDYDSLGFEAKTTIRQLYQVNSRRWAAKALSVGDSLGIRLVYPYIWREILNAQGSIPWNAKIKDGVVKWPLKRLLESYMPESFVYRQKSGFVPPFARWLTAEDFNRTVREVLLDREAAVTRVVPAKVLDSLLADALRGRKLRHSILNFLWGALFTEMWIREHV